MTNKTISSKSFSGFTLVEVLISITIVMVIMTVILFNYSTFTENLALSSAGQEIAISVRQAQTYGLTVKEVSVGGGLFSSAYGIYFNPTIEPNSYYLFVDKDSDGLYDHGTGCGTANTECIEKQTLRNRITISSVVCGGPGCPAASSIQSAHITFLRPNPDSSIRFVNASGSSVYGPMLTGQVVVRSPTGQQLTVTMESTGQVVIEE